MMLLNKRIYLLINVFMFLAAGFFLFQRCIIEATDVAYSIKSIAAVCVISGAVYFIKFIRLFIIWYGNKLTKLSNLTQFAKTSAVNLLIPLKLGDVFRIYCYGYTVKNLLNGLCYILLDRFMDTLALVTLILYFDIFTDVNYTFLFCFLILFLSCVIVLYFTFPGLYKYWNSYLIKSDAGRFKYKVLKLINSMNDIYAGIQEIIHGKGIILYIISIAAWMIEAAGFYIVNIFEMHDSSPVDLVSYLEAALGFGSTDYQKLFVLVGVAITLLAYIAALCTGKIIRRADENRR